MKPFLPKRLWQRTYTSFYRRMMIFDRPLLHAGEPVPVIGEYSARLLERTGVAQYLTFRPGQAEPDIQGRLERGHQCLMVCHRSRPVHCIWAAPAQAGVSYLRSELILEPGDVMLYDTYTLAAFRRRKLTSLRMPMLWRMSRDEGWRRAIALVAMENRPSLENVLSKGYRKLGMYSQVRFGPWQRTWQRSFQGDPLPALIPATR